MKTQSIEPSFQGNKFIGLVNFDDPQYMKKFDNQVARANKYAQKLRDKGHDVFVVEHSDKDALGRSHGGLKTFVLFDKEAEVPNKYSENIQKLTKLFKEELNSDRFVDSFDDVLKKIKEQQNNIAKFIAENTPSKP